jgi:histidinol-phosphate phosphatase family protein
MPPTVDVVVPTIGRPSLQRLLTQLRAIDHPALGRVVVVDDRRVDGPSLAQDGVVVARSGGRGPAAARNVGWHRCLAPWVCFVDDDVVLRDGWFEALLHDIGEAGPKTAAVQGRVRVPLPPDRRPTDRERCVAGLESAPWITADMAIRRTALVAVGGFDERFRRAYREDTDLALRLQERGWQLELGRRGVDHPVTHASTWWCVQAQRGNADDALMTRLHGRDWRVRAGATRGALHAHVATTGVAAATLATLAAGRPTRWTALGAGWWGARTARWAWTRIAPGPRSAGEIVRMIVTSIAIPPVATAWALIGRARARRVAPDGPAARWAPQPPALVLFDRDGTLVEDEPYNGDPAAVRPVEDAALALNLLRRRGIATGIVTNQSGIARGWLTRAQVDGVNREVEQRLGPFQHIAVCPHGPEDRCGCRKPEPGMVLAAAGALGVPPDRCAVIGDIATDVEAAIAAGARPILVPNERTAAEDVERAPEVATGLVEAVLRLIAPAGADGGVPA